jgi:hypothetical protein
MWLARSIATVLDGRVIAQLLHPGAKSRRPGGARLSLRTPATKPCRTIWNEILDGAHARSRQAFRPVQSTHQSSCGRVVTDARDFRSVATAKREFGRFVLSGMVVEACA